MTNEEHDTLLIERVKTDDHAAFRLLIEKYKDQALSLACSILKDQAHAEDVLQEVFVKVYSKIKSFKYQSTFYTWLYRIVVNRCYNELRKRKRSDIEVKDVVIAEEKLSRQLDQNDRKEIIRVALSLIKPDEALVLRLFYLSELKTEEVAEVTGFSLSKVKVTMHRARKSLAKVIKAHFKQEIEDL